MSNPSLPFRQGYFAGQGAVFLSAILWSTSGLFIKLVDWHPMVIAGSRSILAALVLLVLRQLLPGRKSKITLKHIPVQAACGLCYAATMIFFVIANKLTASANAIMLQYTAPVWAGLLGWIFLRERPRWEQWCAIALVSLGMFFIFSGGLAGVSLLGDMLAIASGIAFGANSVVLRAHRDGSTTDIIFFSHIICALVSLPFFFLHPPLFTTHNILYILFMGIFQIGFASALFAYGIRYISAVQAMLTTAIEPVLNPLWVLLAIGEVPAPSVIIGGAVIIAAVVSQSALRRRN